ncbi:MAG: hypothetical protein NTY38_32600, partial [Acidobacteria bacterium]|nr:hypothetical protein [Acidobacteriota bacterium]
FDSWQDGNGQNAIYTAPSNTGIDTYVARFVPGLRVIFITKPFGLKISIDGRNTWPSYSFVWGADSKHTISAPLEQTDSSGRRYSFRGWSNNGDATQEYTVPSGQAPVMVATYELLGRAIVSTSTAGLAVLVDDSPCQTPCILDRPVGSTVKLSVPSTVALGEGLRADFTGWNDSTEASRTFTFTSDSVVLSAGYQTAYRLQMSSDPSAAALFHGDPESADGYYPANSQVWVSVETKPGFKFRRWTGDVTGSLNGAFVIMNGPRSALALFDKVPYIAETGVKNAAGDTPDSVVAPGSLIAITGASLVEEFTAVPSSPLAQSIGGIYVMLAGRILPLVSVAPDQILALLPSDLELGDYTLKVVFPAQPSATAKFTVVRNAPGLFRSYDDAGTAFAMASHEDGSTISPSSPARKDEVVSLFGTGFGPFDKQMVDGFAVPAKPQVTLADSVTLLLGDTPVTPIWSGAAPGMVGMTVTRFRLPGSTPAGAKVQVKARVNNRVSNTLDLPVE